MSNKTAYEVRDIDQSAEIAALKAERDRLTIIADAIQAERDRLRAALAKVMEDAGNPYLVRAIARRALELEEK